MDSNLSPQGCLYLFYSDMACSNLISRSTSAATPGSLSASSWTLAEKKIKQLSLSCSPHLSGCTSACHSLSSHTPPHFLPVLMETKHTSHVCRISRIVTCYGFVNATSLCFIMLCTNTFLSTTTHIGVDV